MKQYDNTNRGSIWKNDKKEKETQPDYTGGIDVEGKQYFLNGWTRKPGANPKAPAMSFSVMPKTEGYNTTQNKSEEVFPSGITEEDLPF
tara:strand:+ start:254 stop:520 length:267 start_codon:yes stop_codon:yes gene_type:complete